MNDTKSPQSKSNQSASTSVTMPEPTIQSQPQQKSEFDSTATQSAPEQKSDSRMKRKPNPAQNTKDSDPTM